MTFVVSPKLVGSVPIPANITPPIISGVGTVGQILTVSTGTWSGTPTYTYQWNRNGVAISGATSSSYTLVTADNGTMITATVTATNVSGSTAATAAGISIGAAAHRYWRVVAYQREIITGTISTVLSEIEMKSTFGGSDLCTGGTASAISGTAASAFDNDGSTSWSATASALPAPDWIKYDFGVGVAYEIKEITLRAFGAAAGVAATDPGKAPQAFGLEWSDDNVVWTQQFGISGERGWGDEQMRTYRATGNAAVAKQLWRINVTAVNGGTTANIREIQMRSTPGGADETSAAVTNTYAMASSNTSSSRPYKAFNDVTTDSWSSASTAFPHWIGYDFQASKDIQEVTIQADASTTAAPNAFDVQYSNDGGNSWITSWSVTGQTGWTTSEIRTFTRPAPPTDSLLTSGDMQSGTTDRILLSGDMATGHELIR